VYSKSRSLRTSKSSAARLTGLETSTNSNTISYSGQKRERDREFVDGNSGITVQVIDRSIGNLMTSLEVQHCK